MRRDLIVHLLRTLAPITVGLSPRVERGSYCADLSLTALVSCLRGSPNKSPGYGSLGKACHPESFDCHSERSEESQDKLREGSQTSRHSSPEPALSSL
jgi:hypothetical protein